MARKASRANSVWFALGLALVAGILTAVLQGMFGLWIVTGQTLDWYKIPAHDPVEQDLAVVDLAAGLFVAVFIAVGLNAVSAMDLARRGVMRGNPLASGLLAAPKLASAHTLTLAFLGGAVAAIVGAGTGFLLANMDGTGMVQGRDFFLAKTALGGVLAFLAVYMVVRNIADNFAAGRIESRSDRGNLVARMALGASRHPVATLGVILLVSGALGAGLLELETGVDVTDVLPRGDPNTEAAKNVTESFKSAFTQQVSVVVRTNPAQCRLDSERLLPDRVTPVDCTNITDEVYIRATDELQKFILADSPDLIYSVTATSFYNLVNWTLAGGEDAPNAAFELPGTGTPGERRYAAVHDVVWAAEPIRKSLIAPMAKDGSLYTNLFFVAPDSDLELKRVGEQAIASLENWTAYTESGRSTWKVFTGTNSPTFNVDLPVGDAHASELTREDFRLLVPLILGFIALSLLVAFRDVRSLLVAAFGLVISFVWTMGLMGWVGIPLSAVNIAIIPLILGVGIDYFIHQVTEYLEHRREGLSDAEAFRIAGERSGVALAIATVTTISGLVLMMVSPSLMIAELGGVAAFAMLSVYFTSVLFVPAAMTLMPGTEKMAKASAPSTTMPALAAWVSRHRAAVGVFCLLLTGATVLSSMSLENEEFGEPAKNFPEDDKFRLDHEANIATFYGLGEGQAERKTNIIVFEGDVMDPRTHVYMERLQSEMAGFDVRNNRDGHLDMSTSRSLPFLIRVWLTVRDGAPGAGTSILTQELNALLGERLGTQPLPSNYPRTREEVVAITDAVFASPLAPFASIFINYNTQRPGCAEGCDISIITFATETGDFEVAKAGWDDVQTAIENAGPLPVGRDGEPLLQRPGFVGNTALNYLFITKELPWLGYLGIATTITVIILVAFLTHSVRATLCVGTLITVTSVWWLGILPLVGIGLAITLVLPAVFIAAIGSDYAVHMAHNMIHVGEPRRVYETTGKAVLYSFVTTLGPFILFTATQNVAVAKTMAATAIAIAIIFVSTILIVPLFYPLSEREQVAVLTPPDSEPPVPAAASEDGNGPPLPRVRVVDARRLRQ